VGNGKVVSCQCLSIMCGDRSCMSELWAISPSASISHDNDESGVIDGGIEV
jgi:hypothetical protein